MYVLQQTSLHPTTDIPVPVISVEQVSQLVVRASLSVTDTQCVVSYQVDATPTSGTASTSSSTESTFNVTGLNVCENNYTLAGSVITAGGVQSTLSSPFSFTANLSGTLLSIVYQSALTQSLISPQI